MNNLKKILLISVILFIISIILGNVFSAVGFEIGRYIAMALLYISIPTIIVSLIGYMVVKKGKDEKVPTWIIVIIGIIIAVVIANTISSIIEYNQDKKIEYNKSILSN